MKQRYEYDFVRMPKGVFSTREPRLDGKDYREVIRERAAQGWRLVQVFAPGVKGLGEIAGYDLIFEREVAEGHDFR